MPVQVPGVQQGQVALEDQDVQTQGLQVDPEDQQVLEDPRWTHLLDPAGLHEQQCFIQDDRFQIDNYYYYTHY